MRKYYIFIIQSEYYRMYRQNPQMLYKWLEKLYHTKWNDFGYGLSIYHQICLTFNTDLLNNYFRRKTNNSTENVHFALSDRTIIQINRSCIIVLTAYNCPLILKNLLYYNRLLFVCDFINQDYFWLEKQYRKPKTRI